MQSQGANAIATDYNKGQLVKIEEKADASEDEEDEEDGCNDTFTNLAHRSTSSDVDHDRKSQKSNNPFGSPIKSKFQSGFQFLLYHSQFSIKLTIPI